MTTVRAVIADDEPALRDQLERMLRQQWPELAIVGRAADGVEALALIRELRPDVALLDIRMPRLSGLAVAAQVAADCRVVFVTAYDDYAVQAFDSAAVDYLLKPVDPLRLGKSVDRLRRLIASSPAPATETEALLRQLTGRLAAADGGRLHWLRVGERDGTALLAVDDVVYFRAGDKYTTAVTPRREYLLRKSLKELEQGLDPETFWRIHRSTIVNVRHVDLVHNHFNGSRTLTLKDRSDTLTVSRAYRHLFDQM